MDIRERIKAVIAANDEMTVRGVSLSAGLSDSALHKFLTGGTDSITLKTVAKLAKALDVDEVWLAYGEGTPERATDVAELMAKMTAEDQARALEVLKAFARTGTDG